MIIRILGQGQFEMKSSLLDELNQIDNTIVACVEKGDEAAYKKNLSMMIELILKNGTKVPDDELVTSSVLVPPGDMTIDEARKIFTGEGIFKG